MSGNEPSRTGRTEPVIGDIEQINGAPRREPSLSAPPPSVPEPLADRTRERSGRRGLWGLLTLLLVVVLGALLWINQDRLRMLLPRTELNSLLDRADAALAQGKLDGDTGDSARELYEAARALEPDNNRALDGLQHVGEAELALAGKALAAGNADAADQALAEARSLLGGGTGVQQMAQRISQARQSQAQTDTLIQSAQAAFTAGKLVGDDGAAALYRKALVTDPGNAVARHGLDKIGDALASQARQSLQAGDLDSAAATVDQIGAMLPEYGDLPSLRADVAHARRQADAAIKAHLDQATEDLRAGRFTGSGDDNALAQYHAVLAVDANNAQAKAGLGQVAQALLVQASASMDGNDLDQAAKLIQQASLLAPKSAELAAAQSRLASLREEAQQAAPPSHLDPTQQAKIDQLIQRGRAALKAGDLMAPPGACAYDLFRSALAIDGNNAQALNGLQSLSGRATTLFQQSLGQGDLKRAGVMLETLEQLDPGDPAQDGLRHQLASAWMDRAEHQLQTGDRGGAAQSLDAARRLQPEDPRLQVLSARLGGG